MEGILLDFRAVLILLYPLHLSDIRVIHKSFFLCLVNARLAKGLQMGHIVDPGETGETHVPADQNV